MNGITSKYQLQSIIREILHSEIRSCCQAGTEKAWNEGNIFFWFFNIYLKQTHINADPKKKWFFPHSPKWGYECCNKKMTWRHCCHVVMSHSLSRDTLTWASHYDVLSRTLTVNTNYLCIFKKCCMHEYARFLNLGSRRKTSCNKNYYPQFISCDPSLPSHKNKKETKSNKQNQKSKNQINEGKKTNTAYIQSWHSILFSTWAWWHWYY